MPPKICGKCSKTVYPTEELKCLDKVWHKGCFKCQECNMTLNMKNYKGYNKLPYCNAHYPTTKHTVVADTPENRRITKNTQIQSNIKYHEDFEKAKGSKISVAADPETERIKKTMQTISNVSYHGELEKKMEQESHRPSHAVEGQPAGAPPIVAGEPAVNDEPPSSEPHQSGYRAYNYEPQQQQQQHGIVTMNQPHRRQPGSISNYDPMSQESVYTSSPYSNQRVGTRVYSSSQASEPQPRTRRVGSIADYDPVNEQFGSIAGQYTAPPPEAAPAPPTEQYREPSPPPVQYREPSPPPVQYREPSPPPVQYREPSPPPVQYREPSPPPQQSYREPSPPPVETYYREPSPPPEPSSPLPAADMFARSISQPPQEESIDEAQPSYGGNRGRSGLVCRAIYDYTAADTDEVSFTEGDCIVNCQVIDEGWMTGVVQRTGRQGMLPSNYVEPINQ